jgi:hypothetical protein
MRTVKRTSLPLLLILLGVFACVIPGVPQVDQNAAGTAVQQTLGAIIKQTEDAGQSVVDVSSDTPVPSSTPFPTFTAIQPSPSLTATATFTLPPPLPTLTLTPNVPMVSVSVATNCRLGPGKTYQLVGFLDTGRWVQVYARDPGNAYWYIRNPANSSQFCWIWGEYATVIGLNSSVPIYTPPPTSTPTITPTPAPDFDAWFSALQTCSGKWWADIKLKNTGSTTLRSVTIRIKDTVTGVDKTSTSNDFTDQTGCSSTSKDTLLPGKTLVVSSPSFGYNPDNHKINVTVSLYTQVGQNGFVVTKSFSFKP